MGGNGGKKKKLIPLPGIELGSQKNVLFIECYKFLVHGSPLPLHQVLSMEEVECLESDTAGRCDNPSSGPFSDGSNRFVPS